MRVGIPQLSTHIFFVCPGPTPGRVLYSDQLIFRFYRPVSLGKTPLNSGVGLRLGFEFNLDRFDLGEEIQD